MAGSSRPTGTITFLFTDIEGSTKLWDAHHAAMAAAVRDHDALLRDAIESHSGSVFKTIGDAFCAAFPTPASALASAIAAQRALAAHTWGETGELRARMALHSGEAEERDADYFGPTVNRVARLLAAGHGGQLLLSQAVADALGITPGPDISLRDLGERRLKGLAQPERVYQVIAPGLAEDFPPLRTLDARPNNLPDQATPLLGRDAELDEVKEWLRQPDCKILTLTGPGGTGKTRLALQVAADLIDDFAHGVWFVDLSAVTNPALVSSEIAGVLRVSEEGGSPIDQQLRDHLHDKELLLVLDNLEHILEAGTQLAALRAESPGVKLLITSRAPLRITGEQEYPVPPLGVPDTKRLPDHEHLLAYPAVELFVQRAVAVKHDFALTAENAPAVAQICADLDGLPLAIELAAARVRLLPPQAMLARLSSRLKLLTGGARDRPERQQTMRGAIAWSYDLLPREQQTLLARLSVFSRGATFEAADAVCAGPGVPEDPDALLPSAADLIEVDVFEGIGALVDHSLLRQDVEYGEARFTMLETIREFGLERLAETGDVPEVRRRHAAYFLHFAERTGEELFGPNQAESVRSFDAEHDDLRGALSWALETRLTELGLRLGRSLVGYWQLRGFLSEGRSWLERILAQGGEVDLVLRARVLNNLGALASGLCDFDLARTAYEESLAVWRDRDDRRAMAIVLTNLGQVARSQGDYTRARELHDECLSMLTPLQDQSTLALALHNLGLIAHDQGDFTAAQRHYEEALEARQIAGDVSGIAHATRALAHVLHDLGERPASHELFQSAIGQFREIGDQAGLAQSLTRFAESMRAAGNSVEATAALIEALTIWKEIGARRSVPSLEEAAELALDHQHHEPAARLFGAADALRTQTGEPLPPIVNDVRRERLGRLQAALGPDAFGRAWQAGSALDPDAALDDAIAEASLEIALPS